MLVVVDETVFHEPWWDLRGHGLTEDGQRQALHDELVAELKPSHPLHGRSFTVIARSGAQDDILVEVDNGTWAIVHLSWKGDRERSPWPTTTVFESLQAAVASLSCD